MGRICTRASLNLTSMSGRRKSPARHTAAASRVGPESPSASLAMDASVATREACPPVRSRGIVVNYMKTWLQYTIYIINSVSIVKAHLFHRDQESSRWSRCRMVPEPEYSATAASSSECAMSCGLPGPGTAVGGSCDERQDNPQTIRSLDSVGCRRNSQIHMNSSPETARRGAPAQAPPLREGKSA